MLALGLAYWAVASRTSFLPTLDESQRLSGFLPFASARASVVEPIVFGGVLVAAAVTDRIPSDLRTLRVLPISSTRLASFPIGQALVSTVMLWIVLFVLHVTALDAWPVSLRPDLFVAFAGLAALTRTVRYVGPGGAQAKAMLGVAPVAVIWLALGFTDAWRPEPIQSGMLVGGFAALAAAFVVMRRAITRGRRVYQTRPSHLTTH